jgi:amidohydrolase
MNIKFKLTLIIIMALQTSSFAQLSDKILGEAKTRAQYAYELCKKLHADPELSFQEFETAKKMASELEKAGFEVTMNVGGNNVVGLLKNGEGPVIMLRTDMDALPVEEKTNLEFASTKTVKTEDGSVIPVMHACGHDVHMSVWTGTIHTLAAFKDHWKGTLLVIAQQAEEASGGAAEAIEAGLFSRFPVPDYALAYHINPELESGKIGLIGGPVFAGVRSAEIKVFGEGGHGAYPEKCIDPIVIASRIVMDLQTIVSRELSPLKPAVVTVGSIHGGTRPNIIPDEVIMELTLRYYDDEVIEQVISAIKRISNAASQMAGLPEERFPEVNVSTVETPPVINDTELAGMVKKYASGIIGPDNITEVSPAMVAEDFGKYGRTPENIPICLIWLGSTSTDLMKQLKESGREPFPLHSPYLNPDYQKTIETGIIVMTGNVLGLMNANR